MHFLTIIVVGMAGCFLEIKKSNKNILNGLNLFFKFMYENEKVKSCLEFPNLQDDNNSIPY